LSSYLPEKIKILLQGWVRAILGCESLVSQTSCTEEEWNIYLLSTNYLRYKLFCKYLKGTVYREPLVNLLRKCGVSEGVLGVLLCVYDDCELEKFVILLSGVNGIHIPSAHSLLKMDTYLEIVRRYESGESVKSLATRYKKAPKTIASIIERFKDND